MFNAPDIDGILETQRESLMAFDSQSKFNRHLEQSFKEYNIRCSVFRKMPKQGDYSVGGIYDWSKDKIHIQFIMHKKDRSVILEPDDWYEFKFLFSQTLQHELIHRHQYIKRAITYDDCEPDLDHRFFDKISIDDEREYLSDDDEIEAYSHDIAMEILFYYADLDPFVVLQKIDKKRKVWSYNYYKKTFKDVPGWYNIKKKLLKKTYLWLPNTKVYF